MVWMGAGAWAQTTAPAAGTKVASPAPLRLQSLAPDALADPFPAVNPKNFTAESPSVATVDSYLHAVVGYDPKRIWRVVAIQKTAAVGVSKVTALVSERAANAKVQTASFFVLDDGKHLIADNSAVMPFAADPYAETRATLHTRASGPTFGASGKELMLVEFADLQCPHCKDAQATIKKLAADFPQARMVYQSFPLVEIHPFAEKAALYGECIRRKGDDAFFSYVQAVYDTQAKLTGEGGDQALKDAVAKAGGDPAAVQACSTTAEAKSAVDASVRLAADLNIEQTPMLAINGRLVPANAMPYETLKQIVAFQARLDGVKLPAAQLDLK